MNKSILLLTLSLSTVLCANPFAKPSEPNGVLNLSSPQITKDIFPVSIYEIDGKNIISRNTAIWLKPGKHSIKVSSNIDLSYRSHSLTKRQKNLNKNNKTLEINVEDGKMYYVGYDASDRDPNLWKPVVWKVK